MIFGKRTPQSEYAFVPRTDVQEPIHGREKDYRPWEAPPRLSVSEDTDVAMHQGEVLDMYLRLLEGHLPQNLPPTSVDAIISHIIPHAGKNLKDHQGDHERSLMLLPELELDAEELAVHRKVGLGTANMAEIKADFERTKRGSGELAILRVIAGYRAEYEDPMINELRALMGEHFEMGKPRKFRIEGFDNLHLRGEPMNSITLGYKQSYGKLPSGTEFDSRHTFVMRTDKASGFDPSLRDAMQRAALTDPNHVTGLTRLQEKLDEITETGFSHRLVAAGTIKIYLFNREIDRLIAERDAHILQQEENRDSFDTTKLHYFGPKQTEKFDPEDLEI